MKYLKKKQQQLDFIEKSEKGMIKFLSIIIPKEQNKRSP